MRTSSNATFLNSIAGKLNTASRNRHRQLVVLSGAEAECLSVAVQLLSLSNLHAQPAWMGAGAPDQALCIASGTAKHFLGREFTAVVMNTFEGFACDTIAALEGTVIAGGAVILITPALSAWSTYQLTDQDPAHGQVVPPNATHRASHTATRSPFIARFAHQLLAATRAIDTADNPHDCSVRLLPDGHTDEQYQSPALTEQSILISLLVEHAQQDQIHSLILCADRGRGKSAALGIAAARILRTGMRHIVITAPRKRAIDILLKHLNENLDQHSLGSFEFCPPDQLTQTAARADLLIVDEAATIALPLLLSAAKLFPRVVFASTVKGYEGAGRGFAIRFTHLLSQHRLQYQYTTLKQPIRWASNDPLEFFFNRAFILDTPLLANQSAVTQSASKELSVDLLPAWQSMRDEAALRMVFGLLLQAHYKTTPNDLSNLLDSDNLDCYTLNSNGVTLGAALVALEGPVTELDLRQGILRKQRRPKGHLLPQLFAQFTGAAHALDLRIARIVRIAIHPDCQRSGLGSWFLQQLENEQNIEACDAVGAMFSAVPETLNFWRKNQYTECHIGARKQTSSGYASISVLKPRSPLAHKTCTMARLLFVDAEAFRASEHTTVIVAEPIVAESDRHTDTDYFAEKISTLDAHLYDAFVLQQFKNGARSFHDSHASLARFARRLKAKKDWPTDLSCVEQTLLTAVQSPRFRLQPGINPPQGTSPVESKKAILTRLKLLLERDPSN